ncbi:MAG: efflux RND transporter permease subunit [Eubacteriales bacterium]
MKNHGLATIIHWIVYKGKHVERIFGIATVICLLLYPFVGVNYDLSEYLPDFAPTRQALDVMEREFGYPGMARIMLQDTTLYQTRVIQNAIEEVDGVDLVIGPDTLQDSYLPQEFHLEEVEEQFYKDGCAQLEIIFTEGDSDKKTHRALDEIYEIVGDRGCFSGTAVSNKSRQETVQREVAGALVLSVVIIAGILTLTTTSWFEPLLFLLVMGVAIILNMGSNIVFGTISFFTFSTAAILQLAVSMDYSIFLLHTFTAKKQQGMEIHQAMEEAIREACSSILASGATTIVGFLAIALMQFTVGKDVGFVLTKGILLSLATVLILMPALILRFDERIERMRHRSFMPSFQKTAEKLYHIRWGVLVVCILLTVPAYVGQGMNRFLYGDDALGAGPGTPVYEDTQKIDAVFGRSNVLLAILPNGSPVRERELTRELEDLPFMNYALSLAGTLPQGIPEDFLPQELVEQMRTEEYTRVLMSIDTVQESDYAFQCSDQVLETVEKWYPEGAYLLGMTPTTQDVKNILTVDYSRVSILSMIGVALVVLCTFQAPLVPILVMIPIEVAIYLNMTIPYVLGETLLYIGYIIVSCLQLGATIDYSILLTNHYMALRQTLERQEAAIEAIRRSALSILTSGSILMVVGYGLYFTSTIQGISQMGRLVGRGAMLSVLLVLSLLPALLAVFDNIIQRQQRKAQKRAIRVRKWWRNRRRKRLAGGEKA